MDDVFGVEVVEERNISALEIAAITAVSSPTHRKLSGAAPAAGGAPPPPAAGPPAVPTGTLRRIGSRADSWASSSRLMSSLLRHSSIGGNYTPTGTWFTACYYVVSTVGAPFMLGLPAATARLGWGPGMLVLLLSYLAVLYTACITAKLHLYRGTRHTRYRELGQAVFGKRRGTYLILPFQLTVDVGMCVTYGVISGQSLQGICVALSPSGACGVGLSVWIVIFCCTFLVLALLPDISSISWVQLLGAAMTVGYSVAAVLGAGLAGRGPDVTYELQGTEADKVFNAFSSLGAVCLLYGNIVLVETQSILRTEPSPIAPMIKAVIWGYTLVAALLVAVVVACYYAFGAVVQPLVFNSIAHPTWLVVAGNVMVVVNSLAGYLIFAHALFDWVDLKIMMSHWTGLEFQGGLLLLAKRWSFRWAFVVVTGALAVCLPFFQDLMGFLGAVGYAPLCFVLPCVMWLKTQRGLLPWYETALCWAIMLAFGFVGVAAAVGSLRAIVVLSSTYQFFS